MQKPKNLREALWMTLLWFDLFQQPVSAAELHRFLFWKKASLAEVERACAADPRIGTSFGLYFVQGNNALLIRRARRQQRVARLWQVIKKSQWLFRATPFVQNVSVGNTLAMGWPDAESDIDLFVITRKKRLFLARSFLTIITSLSGIRRHGDKIAGRFCLSFFVDESALDFENIQIDTHDPYLAFWIATLAPVWGRGNARFFKKNEWVRDYFPNLPWPPASKTDTKKSLERRGFENLFSGKMGDAIERWLRTWQLARAMKKKKNTEPHAVVLSPVMLKFHETDKRRFFLKRWEERVQNL